VVVSDRGRGSSTGEKRTFRGTKKKIRTTPNSDRKKNNLKMRKIGRSRRWLEDRSEKSENPPLKKTASSAGREK